jgi:DNA-binding transcriptional ArsR family regulator
MIELQPTVEILAALAHEARLGAFRILVRAGPEGLAAGQLAKCIGLGATAASFHFNRLRQAGLVQRRRAGSQIIYSANFKLIRELRDFLDTECCAETSAGCGPECVGAVAEGPIMKPRATTRQEV